MNGDLVGPAELNTALNDPRLSVADAAAAVEARFGIDFETDEEED